MCERVAYAAQALFTEAGDGCEPAIVCGGFDVRQSFEAELLVQPVGQDSPDARHGCQERERIRFPAQPVEHRETAMCEHLANCTRNALTDAPNLFQARKSARPVDLVDRFDHRSNRFGRLEVGTDAKAIRSLIVKEVGCLFQPAGDLLVDRMHGRSPLLI
jgi:hypothetical protein